MYTQHGRSLWDRTDRKAHPGGLNELSSNALMIVEVSHVWSGFLALGEKKERGEKGKRAIREIRLNLFLESTAR